MRELDLEEIHSRTLDLMDHIHNLCDSNGLSYYLHYGTLIGAVRHNGFIPWDDDFDIAMKREDFDKFCSIVENAHHPYYRLCNRANTENYYYGIPRYVDTRYKYVSKLSCIKEAEMGIFVDIYPLDNLGNTPEEAKRIKQQVLKLNTEFIIYMNWRSTRAWYYTIPRIPLHIYYRLKHGRKFWLKVDDLVRESIKKLTNESDEIIGLACWDATVWPLRKEWFDEPVLHSFEDRQYWIPKEYDSILRQIYGDYMKLPPESERIPHHPYIIFEQ